MLDPHEPGQSPLLPPDNDKELRHKDLRDEIQLYWTIQLGTITALGALMGFWPKGAEAGTGDGILIRLVVLAVGLVLITVAGMYNVVGNYYSFVANDQLGRLNQQESVVTPWMASGQSFISAFLGGAMAAVLLEGIASMRSPFDVNCSQQQAVAASAESATKNSKFSITWNQFEITVRDHKTTEAADGAGSDKNHAGQSGWMRSTAARLLIAGLGCLCGFGFYGYSVAKAIDSFKQRRDNAKDDATFKILDDFLRYSADLQNVAAIWLGITLRQTPQRLR